MSFWDSVAEKSCGCWESGLRAKCVCPCHPKVQKMENPDKPWWIALGITLALFFIFIGWYIHG